MGEVGVGGPVEGRHRDEVVAGAEQVEHRHADRGRPGADRHRPGAALEAGQPTLEHVHGRVVDPVVMKARGFEVHDRPGVIGVDEVVRDRLVDRDGDGASGIRGVAAVNGERLVVHRWVGPRSRTTHAAARRSVTSCARSGTAARPTQPVRVQRGRCRCPAVLDGRGHLSNGKVGHSSRGSMSVARARSLEIRHDLHRLLAEIAVGQIEDTGRRRGRKGSGARRAGTRAAGSACRTPDGPGRGRTAHLHAVASPPTSRRPRSRVPITMR